MAEIPISERFAVLTDNEGWFGRAPKAFQEAIFARCEWVKFAAGQLIHRATDQQSHLIGVVDGMVEIYSRFGAGDNPLLHIAHEGFWVGYGPAITGSSPQVSVVARVETLLARVLMRSLKELLEQRPEWWRMLADVALEQGGMAMAAYADTLIADKDRRCACTLLRITGLSYPRRSRPERALVSITQDELSILVNVSRTTLVQILRRLERRGLIEQGYRSLRVIDTAGLEAVASGR
jgi:CRP/FNR family transcriptional regulator, cyclic AMP receptor protein